MSEEEKPLGKREVPASTGKKLIGLKTIGYKDYLASRVLFNSNLLHQACIYANTCIEKEMKAYLFAMNIDFGKNHDTMNLYNLLYRNKKNTAEEINKDFIKILNKIYKSRYYESLPPSYNFVIIRNKFLAELDYIYSVLESKVIYGLKSHSWQIKPLYKVHKENGDIRLYFNNYLLSKIDKIEFLNLPDFVHEFRVVFNHETIEATYEIPFNKNSQQFIYEGLIPSEDGRSNKISNMHEGVVPMVYRNGELLSLKQE